MLKHRHIPRLSRLLAIRREGAAECWSTKKIVFDRHRQCIQSCAKQRSLSTSVKSAGRQQQQQQQQQQQAIIKSNERTLRSVASSIGSQKFNHSSSISTTTTSSNNNNHNNNAVDIEIDGKIHSFSPILLRDLDEAPHSIDQSTRQKLFSTAEIPRGLRARTLDRNDRGVEIEWVDGVEGREDGKTNAVSGMKAPAPAPARPSSVRWEVLRRLAETGSTKPPAVVRDSARILWDASTFPNTVDDVDYDAYMNDDAVLWSALQQLHTFGLLFLDNVPAAEGSVAAIAERIGPVKNTFYGYTWDVRSVPQAKNVAYTAQDLGFHMDLLYMQQPPHLQFLHCIRSSSAGGASLFTDAFRSAVDLHAAFPDAFDTLATSPVNFHYDHPSSHYYYQARRVFEMSPRPVEDPESISQRHDRSGPAVQNEGEKIVSSIEAVSWSPPFQAPFALHESASATADVRSSDHGPVAALSRQIEQWQSAASVFSGLIHRPDHIYERMMAPGVCVVFDNRRVLHARRAFEVGDFGKERWLRGAYLDKDAYLSRLNVLQYRRSNMKDSSWSR